MQYMLLKKDEFLRERSEQGFIFSSFRLSGPDPDAGSVIGGPLFLVEHIYSLRLSQRDAFTNEERTVTLGCMITVEPHSDLRFCFTNKLGYR